MMELPLYLKGAPTICPIDGGIDFYTERGESKSVVIISDVFSKLFRLYGLPWGKQCTYHCFGWCHPIRIVMVLVGLISSARTPSRYYSTSRNLEFLQCFL